MGMSADERLTIEEHHVEPGQPEPTVLYNMVSPDYFATLRIPVRRGRVFTKADTEKATKVAIVNEAMAKKFWANEDAIGKRFTFFGQTEVREIVGIVKNATTKIIGKQPGDMTALREHRSRGRVVA